MKVLSIFGTRAEAIKMAPLVRALHDEPGIDHRLCVTDQEYDAVDAIVSLFGLQVDHELRLQAEGLSPNALMARLMAAVDPLLARDRPDCVLVHGDTTTAAACALAASHLRIPVGHVEAGLRSGDRSRAFPEEMNRRLVDSLAAWMFAPSPAARRNLQQERVSGRIWVTGNTGIDAAAAVSRRLRGPDLAVAMAGRYGWVDPQRRLVLVTGHRKERFGAAAPRLFAALRELARRPDVQIVYALPLDRELRDAVMDALGGLPNLHLVEALGYPAFLWFMQRARVVLTDSGSIQEEAPWLGTPVLLMRDATERPEAVASGMVSLVGIDSRRIVDAVGRRLADPAPRGETARPTYGDGRACERIVAALCGRPVPEFGAAAVRTASATLPY
ncbi:UDP-N-acetylglucosamine 2-epimerase (non-hydrolyzing) [Pigmentiphaga soli]|uniref:UDP-N-acetylglucosamine 2-epimerase (non-hydrolyzing) n=1 Tax=Pigmentiphaga soli TaxID=1007095 RepID=A0ABP8HGL4_9BURK